MLTSGGLPESPVKRHVAKEEPKLMLKIINVLKVVALAIMSKSNLNNICDRPREKGLVQYIAI